MGSYEYRACRACSEEFKVTRQWQLFCGDKCRKTWNYAARGWCFYCGERANTRDHIHPVSAREGTVRHFQGQETVNACRECNLLLGNNIFCGIEDRLRWLRERFREKYRLNLAAVRWDDEEIGELGPMLRARIRKRLVQRERAEMRSAYMEAVFLEICRLGVTDQYDREMERDRDNYWG